jgi:hypothetical protein
MAGGQRPALQGCPVLSLPGGTESKGCFRLVAKAEFGFIPIDLTFSGPVSWLTAANALLSPAQAAMWPAQLEPMRNPNSRVSWAKATSIPCSPGSGSCTAPRPAGFIGLLVNSGHKKPASREARGCSFHQRPAIWLSMTPLYSWQVRA